MHSFKITAGQNPLMASGELEDLAAGMRAIGLAVDDPMLYACFLDALRVANEVEVRQLTAYDTRTAYGLRLTRAPKSREDGAPDYGLFGGKGGEHAGRGERNGRDGAGGSRGSGRGGKDYRSKSRKDDDSTSASGEENSESADWKGPKCWRCVKKRHFRPDCEEKLWEGCGGTGHGVDVCPSVKQVAKQEALLAFDNTDLGDEAVTTSACMADETTGKSHRV